MIIRHSARTGASDWLGEVHRGMHVFGFNRGQWSIGEVLDHAIRQVGGPGDLDIVSWTIGVHDMQRLFSLFDEGLIGSIRLLLDRSMAHLADKKDRCADIEAKFGKESTRVTRNHAKCWTYRHDGYSLSLRSSANLNRNPRIEWVEIQDDAVIADCISEMVSEIFRDRPPGLNWGADENSFRNISFGAPVDLGGEIGIEIEFPEVFDL